MAGAILSVTVPDTTIRSAWRGPCAKGITPSRMKSCRPIEVAMNSIAQQANPKLKTQREYRRPQFRMKRIGSPSTPAPSPMAGAYRADSGGDADDLPDRLRLAQYPQHVVRHVGPRYGEAAADVAPERRPVPARQRLVVQLGRPGDR